MGYWKRHQNKDLEKVLEIVHMHGYKIIDPPTYYTIRCPCGHHQRQVHLTPNLHHGNQVLRWARRQPCWKEDGKG